MNKVRIYTMLFVAIIAGSSFEFPSHHPPKSALKLPGGFQVQVMADSLGAARHLAVAGNGLVYVKLAKLKNGKGIIVLQDLNGDGIADRETGFGNYIGTGIYVKDGWLYASSNTDVYRYRLNEKGEVIDTAHAEKIVTGLLDRHEHNSKSIVRTPVSCRIVRKGHPESIRVRYWILLPGYGSSGPIKQDRLTAMEYVMQPDCEMWLVWTGTVIWISFL